MIRLSFRERGDSDIRSPIEMLALLVCLEPFFFFSVFAAISDCGPVPHRGPFSYLLKLYLTWRLSLSIRYWFFFGFRFGYFGFVFCFLLSWLQFCCSLTLGFSAFVVLFPHSGQR